MVYKKFFWTSIIFLSLLGLSGCQKPVVVSSSPPPPVTASVSATPLAQKPTKPDYINWKYYSNETYRYKLRYPFNWFLINQNQPPEVINFSNVAEDKLSAPHVVFTATAARKGNYTLTDFPAIKALTDQGRESRQLIIAKSPGLFFSRLGEGNDLFSIFIDHNDYIFNLTWSGTAQDVRNQYQDICLQIAASLEFF